MKDRFPLQRLSLAMLLAIGATSAHAGGLLLYETASDNTGLANAGAAARAQGPSTIAANIAGLSYLEGTQVSGGLQALVGNFEVDYDSSTNVPGRKSGNAVEFIPGASFFASHQLDDRWTLGLGSYSNFGLSEDYNNDWSGRYYAQNATIGGLSLVPSAAYKINEQWSIGVGLQAMYGIMDTELAIDNAPLDISSRADGQLKFQDTTWGFGGNIGVIFEPSEDTRIGLNYTSKVELDFEDGLRLSNPNPIYRPLDGVSTQLDVTVPQTVTLSLYRKINDRLALLASANWQEWSELGQVYVQLDTDNQRSTNLDAGYDDTWHLSVGGQYQATDKLLWNVGVAYDSSAVSDSKRSWILPMQEAYRFGTGLTYALDKTIDLNASYALVWMGDMDVTQTKSLPPGNPAQVSGSFDDAWIQAFSASVTWRF
jgi:long-chain fatty acid transport protein